MGYQQLNIDSNGCYITGGSNGGLTATNLVSLSSIPVICQAGMSPVLSVWNIPLGAISGGEFSSFKNQENIIRIYEMRNIETLTELINAKYQEDKVGNFDPFKYKVTFDGDKMIKKHRCSVKIWHPVDDDIVSIKFSMKFVSSLNNAGVNAQLIELHGGMHAQELLGYFEYQKKNYELKPAVLELALRFGKYSVVLMQNIFILTIISFML